MGSSTAERLRAAGARQIEAWIGPAICGACYEVPDAMAAAASAQRPGIGSRTRRGTTALDLPHAAATELRNLGVAVTESGICTLENEDYFSYRRDPGTGRLAGLVWDSAGSEAPGTGAGTPLRVADQQGGAPCGPPRQTPEGRHTAHFA